MPFCGTCGTSNTGTSFCTNCGSSLGTQQTVTPIQKPAVEQTLLDESGVFISQSRFVHQAQTFAISGVTSVATKVILPKIKGPVVAILIGGILVLASAASLKSGGGSTFVMGLIVLTVGALILMSRKKKYVVVLRSASSEQEALEHPNAEFIDRIVAALNEAIIARG